MPRISDRVERFLEFLIIGLVMGVSEDLLAVWLTTDAPITWPMFGIVVLVALPFAFVSEFIVDHPKFWRRIFGVQRKEEEK